MDALWRSTGRGTLRFAMGYIQLFILFLMEMSTVLLENADHTMPWENLATHRNNHQGRCNDDVLEDGPEPSEERTFNQTLDHQRRHFQPSVCREEDSILISDTLREETNGLRGPEVDLRPNETRTEDPDRILGGLQGAVIRVLSPGPAEALARLAAATMRGPLWNTARGERGRCAALIRDAFIWESLDDHLAASLAAMGIPAVVVMLKGDEDGKSDVEENWSQLLHAPLDALCRAVLLRVRRPRHVVRALAIAVRRGEQRAQRRFLILPNEETVLDMPEMEFMPDLLEVKRRGEDGSSFEGATHAYAGSGDTWRQRVVLDTWQEGPSGGWTRDADGLYPDKLLDLRGRLFTFATFHYPPYTLVPEDSAPDGVELRISEEFARKRNIRWELTVDAENEWGEIFDNFTGNGILGTVAMERAALGFGALYLWHHEYQFLDFSTPYIRTGITCLAPKPQPVPGWRSPALPFAPSMWAAVGASLLVASVALRAVAAASRKLSGQNVDVEGKTVRWSTLAECSFWAFGLLVLQTPTAERREGEREKGPMRHVLNWLTITFLLVTTSYASGLASVLAVPRSESPIDTAAQLATSSVRWAATHEAWVFSLREATDFVGGTLLRRFQVLDSRELRRRALRADLAFAIERLPAGHFAIGEYIDAQAASGLRLMSGDLYWERSTTVAPKGSALLAPLSAFVHRLLDAGLLGEWEAQVARRFLSQRVQDTVRHSGAPASAPDEPSRLTLDHVQGGFYLLILGLAAAAVSCAVEVALSPSQRQRRRWCWLPTRFLEPPPSARLSPRRRRPRMPSHWEPALLHNRAELMGNRDNSGYETRRRVIVL